MNSVKLTSKINQSVVLNNHRPINGIVDNVYLHSDHMTGTIRVDGKRVRVKSIGLTSSWIEGVGRLTTIRTNKSGSKS